MLVNSNAQELTKAKDNPDAYLNTDQELDREIKEAKEKLVKLHVQITELKDQAKEFEPVQERELFENEELIQEKSRGNLTMNKYLKLEDDIPIIDSEFSYEAKKYIDRVGIENCNEFLEDFILEALQVEDLYVENYFSLIHNLTNIGMHTKDIMLFEKAVTVMEDKLQIACDIDDPVTEYVYMECADDYPEDYPAQNFKYACNIIYKDLVKTFTIDKNTRKDILHVYGKTAPLEYSKIKKITINEVEFTDINKAQEYINNQIPRQAYSLYIKNQEFSKRYISHKKGLAPFKIVVVLSDLCEHSDVVINITNYDRGDYWKESLAKTLSNMDSYDLHALSTTRIDPASYEVCLYDYEKECVGVIDLSFLHKYIYKDLNAYIVKHNGLENDIPLNVINFAFSALKESYQQQIKNDGSMEDLFLIFKFFSLDAEPSSLRDRYKFNEYGRDYKQEEAIYELGCWLSSNYDG